MELKNIFTLIYFLSLPVASTVEYVQGVETVHKKALHSNLLLFVVIWYVTDNAYSQGNLVYTLF